MTYGTCSLSHLYESSFKRMVESDWTKYYDTLKLVFSSLF